MNDTKKIKKLLREKFRNTFQVHKRQGSSFVHIKWTSGERIEMVKTFLYSLPTRENINPDKICFHCTKAI